MISHTIASRCVRANLCNNKCFGYGQQYLWMRSVASSSHACCPAVRVASLLAGVIRPTATAARG
eukprot:5510761-Pleurochrysis_carterae.AAC.1